MENPIKMDDLGVSLFLETHTLCYAILLMAEILNNQLRLVVYHIIYKVLAPSQVVQDFSHQQYHHILQFTYYVWFDGELIMYGVSVNTLQPQRGPVTMKGHSWHSWDQLTS